MFWPDKVTVLLCVVISTILAAFPSPASDQVVISEFLAGNHNGLRDEDGDFSDWIELFNGGTNTVDLEGWFLTDSASDLAKWRFPATNLPPNGFLLVFASSKDRAVAGAPLHANFNLDSAGDYLALVLPDGMTIASEFAPQFPEQLPNISYGIGQNLQVTTLLASNAPVKFLIPTNGTLGTAWVSNTFNDDGWQEGLNGIGYETYVPGFAVRNIRATTSVCDLGTADGVLANPSLQAAVFTGNPAVVNYVNTGGGANFGNDATFPGFTINVEENNFVLEAAGIVTIPTGGNWTFGVNSDDGFGVTIGTNEFSYPSPRGPDNSFATFYLAAGDYPARLVFYECGGGSEVEFFAAAGTYSGFNAAFRLVGDTRNGGLPVKSLPLASGSASIRRFILTDLESEMSGQASSAYARLPFALDDPAAFSTLTLRVAYNDGFVAWLNGVEIARRNAPASPQWNSVAPVPRPATNALAFEAIDLTGRLGLLQAGANILAVHGLNDSSNSSTFCLRAELAEEKLLGLNPHYFSTPTPGAPNGAGFFAFVEDLKFTPERGWFQNTNLSITITSATPGIAIWYTLNGAPPTPANGLLYTGPILLTNTAVLRAAGYRDGFEPSAAETHSYLFLDQIQRQNTNSQYVGGSSGDYTLNTNISLGTLYCHTFANDLLSVPTLSITMASDDFFGLSGVWSNPTGQGAGWERPCSAEYMRPDGEKGFNINCGIRIQGGVSRTGILKHSLRLLFKTAYGAGKLNYNLYPDSPVEEFDSLTLHAGFNDHWLWVGSSAQLLRDQWCRDTQNALSGYGAHGRYAHLYVNGIYWGLYNIGEQTDASYAAHYLGGDKDEYDALNADQVVDGNGDAWNALFAIANAGITNDLAYTNLAQYLDIPNFIDYLLLNFYAANTDWPYHNWKAARHRVPGAGFHFFSWDAEWVMLVGSDVNTDRTALGPNDGSPARLYAALRSHPEFLREFGDHAQKYLCNDGPLTPAACDARYALRATEIDRAVVPETARWGGGNDRQTWLNEQNRLRTVWFPQRTAILIRQLRNAGLFPQLDAPALSPFGGLVPPGHLLALTNSNASGEIYYTTDGSDPRLWGGGLASSARRYTAAFAITNATFLRARVRDGANWSALAEAMFYVVQDFRPLVVTEIMYHPPQLQNEADEDLEFLELKNTGTNTLDLSGLAFADGIAFAFTNGTQLAPGEFFVLGRKAAALQARYPGLVVNGIYLGRLNNAGERLTLSHPLGASVFSFAYQTRPPWPGTPDGYGFSLVRASLAGDPSLPASWRPSAALGGSPGADDPLAGIASVVINEIFSRPDWSQTDFIELHNPTDQSADIGGWFLSDDAAQPKKFRIPNGTILSPRGFAVFTEADFNPQPGVFPSFSLSSLGETLFLFSGDAATNLTGYSHSLDFDPAASGVSFGRHLLSTGEEFWPAQAALTPGEPNAGPLAGPVVINEIMYHPEPGYDEFIELKNLSATNVALFDPVFPTNTWKLAGLGYRFPENVTLAPGGFLLLVGVDAGAFRAKYQVPAEVPIFGPYPGALNNAGERLRLERPDPRLDTNGLLVAPYVLVDEVRYGARAPWPANADGAGPSLQRFAPAAYGNEPTNWFASGITPAADNVFNLPPTVTLLSPTNAASFNMPASFALTAQAADPDGTVIKVEFYRDGIKLGEAASSPWTFNVTNLGAGAYTFTAKARDNRQSTAMDAVTVVVHPPPIGTGAGLLGEYYDNIDFTNLKFTRTDPTVSFDWGTGPPDPTIDQDTFSVRWTGKIEPRLTGRYTFFTLSDDGVRLWVDNQLIIDNWGDHAPTENSGGIDLAAGARYDIRMDFYENGGGAVASLAWAAADLPRQIIPATQLYSGRAPSLLVQPQSRTVPAGSNVVFSATADGSPPLRYQWFFNEEALAGETSNNLYLTNTMTSHSGSYWVVVSNTEGAVTSRVATLIVAEAPAYLLQPQSQTVVAGDTVTFRVAVSGTPPFGFRWRKGGVSVMPFGLGSNSLTLKNVQLVNAGIYYAVVSNAVSLAGVTSAGAVLTVLADTDGDRMPDAWESANHLDPQVNEATLDSDHDGLTNLQEYLAGTDPNDPLSYLKVEAITPGASGPTLRFLAVSNKTYSIFFLDSLSDGTWQKLADIPAQATNRAATVTDTNALPARRYYRLGTPGAP